MKQLLIIIFAVFIVSCSSVSYRIHPERLDARIIQYGLYENVGEYYTLDDPSIPSGKRGKTTGGVRLVKQTDKIPLRFGVRFGYDFEIHGVPDGKTIILTCVVDHPPIKRHDGEVATSFRYPYEVTSENGVISDGASYYMNHDYEVVPGTWVRSYYYKGKKLMEKEFFVSEQYNDAL